VARTAASAQPERPVRIVLSAFHIDAWRNRALSASDLHTHTSAAVLLYIVSPSFVMRTKFHRVKEEWVPVSMQLRQLSNDDQGALINISRCAAKC
jgi:hypothetical protein